MNNLYRPVFQVNFKGNDSYNTSCFLTISVTCEQNNTVVMFATFIEDIIVHYHHQLLFMASTASGRNRSDLISLIEKVSLFLVFIFCCISDFNYCKHDFPVTQ